jgi:hypothetical protein
MIIDLASDFIDLGTTLEEKQNHLNAVCIAWNISILPKDARKMALTHFLSAYKENNPLEEDCNIKNIERDMKLLISKKIRKFPNAITPIEYARITENDDEYRILVASSPSTKQPLSTGNSAGSINKH